MVLSALLPAKRTDRVYHLQAPLLTKKLRRCLSLGEGRWQQLEQWKVPERGDLGECVERAQLQAEFAVPLPGYEVTLEEVDRTLENIAKACRFSAPSVRGDSHEGVDVIDSLRRIYHRLQSREAKWFTRMILKDYGNIEINEGFVFRCLDSRLPAMMKIQDNFESAINSLRSLRFSGKTENESPRAVSGPVSNETNHVPKIGVKVGRTTYLIGRSIKNVVDIVDGRTMSVERKYDGEYCQIHIDLTKDQQWIRIFSKSGKDSTKDRRALHSVVKEALRIGHDQCRLSRNCILEGEIVVWNDATKKIMDFCKIRKHVDRSGSFLGTDLDSQ